MCINPGNTSTVAGDVLEIKEAIVISRSWLFSNLNLKARLYKVLVRNIFAILSCESDSDSSRRELLFSRLQSAGADVIICLMIYR